MTTARELERKYDVPQTFAVPTGLAGLGLSVGEPAQHTLEAVYFDTPDLRLARNGVAVRRRTGGTDAGWHIKRYRDSDERTELRLSIGRRAATEIPPRVLAEVRALSRGAPLQPVVRLATTRTEWPLRDEAGRMLALIADDMVSAQTLGAETTVQEWREVEVEVVDGDGDLLDAVEEALRSSGARRAGAASKLARALDGRLPSSPAPEPAGPGLPRASAAAVAVDYLRRQRDALVEFDPKVRRDEPDAVHQMRVATRRLRSALKTFRPFLDRPGMDGPRAELRWLGEVLGAARDPEVLAARLAEAVAAEPPELVVGPVAARITGRMQAQLTAGRRALLRALDGERYARLLDDLDELLVSQPTLRGAGRAGAELPRRVRTAVRRTDRAMEVAARAPRELRPGTIPIPGVMDRDTALHEARKAAKQARYAAEAAAPAVGKKAKRLANRMKAVQEVLGDHHDSVVARSVLRADAMRSYAEGENTFTYGLLHARQAAEAARLEHRLPEVWQAASRRKVRSWLR